MFLLNSLQYKNYSLWSCLSNYISIIRYFFRTGSKKEKKNKIRKCQMRLVGCFSVSCLMMFHMYSNVSLDARRRFLNSLSSQLLYPSPRFISWFTFSSLFPFFYLSQGSYSCYNNINVFFYIIFIHLPFLTPYQIQFIYILFTLLHFLKTFLKSSILFLRQLK